MSKFIGRALAAALPLSILAAPALASGFALREASPGAVGRAFAGEGAIADSAATVWYNPAGMTQLPGFTATGGVHLLFVNSGQSDLGTTRTIPGVATPVSTGGSDGGNPFHPVVIVPTLYASMQLTDRLWAGLGVNTPFGLVVDYDDGWFGRYDSTRSVVKTYNVQPSLAWKIDDRFSIGGGVSVQYIEADLNNALPNLSPLLADGHARVKGDDISFGWNLGGRFESGPIAVGIHYRSQVKHRLKGEFTIEGLQGPLAGSNAVIDARAPITLPDSLGFSAAFKASEQARILASAEWTNWSVFDAIRIQTPEGAALSTSPQHYKDSWSFHLGGEYDLSDRWTVRTGIATDSTPTVDEYRTSRVPDGDRVWLTAGASWKLSDTLEARFSYAHVFVTTEPLDREDHFYAGTAAAITSNLRSENSGSVNMIGADFTVRF